MLPVVFGGTRIISFINPRYCHLKNRHHSIHHFASESNDVETANNTNDQLKKTRFRARVAYHGTQFHGWQLQTENRSTVQGAIEGILKLRFQNRRIPVLGAGRTDAGVHARGQAIHFDLLPHEIPFIPPLPPTKIDSGIPIMVTTNDNDDQEQKCNFCNELEHSLNRMLPLDIRIFNLQLAPYTWTIYDQEIDDQSTARARPWHAIQSANTKWYSYRFTLGPTLWNPKERYTRTHFVHRPSFVPKTSKHRSKSAMIEPYTLTKQDIDRLQSILKLYEGTHDFKAFGGQIEQNEKKSGISINTVRTVYRVELVKEPLKESYSFANESPSSDFDDQKQSGFLGEEGNYRINFLLQGALYKMVRNMVGTAIEVWLGRMAEEQLVYLLQNNNEEGDEKLRRKDNPCKPAPPEGLTLECVYYDDNF